MNDEEKRAEYEAKERYRVKKDRYHLKVRGQLDCSPKLSFNQISYRKFVAEVLKQHPKYVVLTEQTSCHSLNIKNLLTPFYEVSFAGNFDLYKKTLRWFRWWKKVTESRELRVKDLGGGYLQYS